MGAGFCGSWLACDSGVSANRNGGCESVIAGKPAPTGVQQYLWGGCHEIDSVLGPTPVGPYNLGFSRFSSILCSRDLHRSRRIETASPSVEAEHRSTEGRRHAAQPLPYPPVPGPGHPYRMFHSPSCRG
ncbi:hypothetical protein DBR46_21340 [Pseudomonas sp. KBW05]|nr:hypothetical protein DBR46_21340 [Pseudomonas sp. KBW05]